MQDFVPCKAPFFAGAKPKLFPLKGEIQKIILVMRITAMLMLAFTLHVAAKTRAQDKISLSFTNAPLEQVFNSITAQTDIAFLYRPQYVQGKQITIKIEKASLRTVLDLCLKNQQLTYEIIGSNVAVRPVKKENTGSPVESNENAPPLIEVKGQIFNAEREPVSGATVAIEGTTKSAITDVEGRFSFTDVKENSVLLISHVLYESQQLKVNGGGIVSTTLKVKINSLDEMQVIAYGSTTKRFNTGNVSSVKGEEIAKQPISNPLLALQGKVPGLLVSQSTGVPGTGVKIIIQGMNSLFNSNDPLYIVDGVPYTSQLLPNLGGLIYGSSGTNTNVTGGNPLNYINPTDIESISVLKDADATAIYGSRGANGVILITTKKGRVGRTSVDLNFQQGWGKVTRKLDLLDTEQYLTMRKEALRNEGATVSPTLYDVNGVWDTTRYTNWQNKLIGNTAKYTLANLNISGGTPQLQYLLGGTYRRETTVFPGEAANQKGAVHFNLTNTSINRKFKFQISVNYLYDHNKLPTGDFTGVAVTLAPNAPALRNDDGSINWAPDPSGTSTWSNPLNVFESKYVNTTHNMISNAVLSYTILPGLDVRSSFGITNMWINEVRTSPLTSVSPDARPTSSRTASYSDNRITSWIIEPQLNYKKTFGKAKLDVLAGVSKQRQNNNGEQLTGSNYNSDQVLEDPKAAASISITSSIQSVYKYLGVFGRIGVNWDEKYLLNLTGRRDGSSRFGKENQFHNFGSVGAAWIFTEETFLSSQKVITYGKLRASYGTTGSDQIGDYRYLDMFNTVTQGVAYQGGTALMPGGLQNPFLQWEETKKLQGGLDLGFFQERINASITYFRNRSSNQLLPYVLPVTTGFFSMLRNFPATVQNTGWELSLSSVNIKSGNFTWNTQINFTIPKNKLVSFPGLDSSSYATSYVIDKPVTVERSIRYAGVNATTGLYQFYDANGEITSSPDLKADAVSLSSPDPTFYGGFENNFRYKDWSLDVSFQFTKRIGQTYFFGSSTPGAAFRNQPVTVLGRWQKLDDEAAIQKFGSNAAARTAFTNLTGYSDGVFEDASYLRLRNVSLSWQLPKIFISRLHIQNVRVYAQAQNLLTITNYKGLDPETMSSTSLPPLRMITVGIQVGL